MLYKERLFSYKSKQENDLAINLISLLKHEKRVSKLENIKMWIVESDMQKYLKKELNMSDFYLGKDIIKIIKLDPKDKDKELYRIKRNLTLKKLHSPL